MRESLRLQPMSIPNVVRTIPSFEGSGLIDEVPEVKTVLADTAKAVEDAEELKSELKMGLAQVLFGRLMDECIC